MSDEVYNPFKSWQSLHNHGIIAKPKEERLIIKVPPKFKEDRGLSLPYERKYLEIQIPDTATGQLTPFLLGKPDPREFMHYVRAGFEHDNRPQHNNWASFVVASDSQPVYVETRHIYRSRVYAKGKMSDVFYIYATVEGFGRDNKPKHEDIVIGMWHNVTFTTERNDHTGQYYPTGTDQHLKQYDFIYDPTNDNSKKALQFWIDHSNTDLILYLKPSLRGNDVRQIYDTDAFVNATFSELIQVEQTGRPLTEIRAMKQLVNAMPGPDSKKVSK